MAEPVNKPLKIEEIIGMLDSANKTLETPVDLPSISEKIVLAPLNAFHTKNIIKSAASGLFADYQFSMVMYHIFKEIVKFPIDKLNIVDKNVLLLLMRSKNISDDLEIELKGLKKIDDVSTVDTIKHKIKISKFLSKLGMNAESDFQEITVTTDEYSVTIKLPSIKDEFDFAEHLFKNKLANIDEQNKTAVRNLIGPVFVYTIAPYIKQLTIGEHVINVNSKKIDERLAIVEKLSANLTNKIMRTIDGTYGKLLMKTTDIKLEKDDVQYSGSIKIDADLFVDN